MLTDLRLAFRQLLKSRGFAFVAIVTLAVGIGASTAMFSTLRALVMKPFDYPEPDRIVQVWSGNGWPLSPADYFDLEKQNRSFAEFGIYEKDNVNLGGESARGMPGARVSPGVLPTFGVAPFLGRGITEEDCRPGAAPVAIISYNLWQQMLGGDVAKLGHTIRINSADVTVIGVMPRTFEFVSPWMRTEDAQIWLPKSFNEEERKARDSHYLCAVGRLKPGITAASADSEIKAIGLQLAKLYPDSNTHKKFLVRPLREEMTNELGGQIWLLFAAVALVLLVACANVAAMLLARNTQRQGEFAVRVALGAPRGRLARLALTESGLLAFCGIALGLLLAWGGIEVLRAIAPATAARKAALSLDWLSVAFAVGTALFTALGAGLPTALAAARTSLSAILRQDARGAGGPGSRHLMLRGLLVGQIAVAFVLANGAALFSAAYFKILEQNKLLSTDRVLSARVSFLGPAYKEDADRVRMWEKLAEKLATVPGVTSVGLTSKLPLEGGSNTSALVNDEVYDPTVRRRNVERSSVTPGYFETMGLTLLRGRNLTSADDMTKDGHLGVVVNRAFVEKCWPDKDPIGQVFRANQAKDPWYTATVVGVVENVRQWSATAVVQAEMYTTPPRHWGDTVYINLRTTRPASFLAAQLRQVVAEIDPELPVEDIRTLDQVVQQATVRERSVAGLVDFFMAIALGLVAVGLYGTLSYMIAQRTREIGVRLALGAMGGGILRLVLAQGLRWVLLGLGIGLAGTLALTGVLKGLVYGMTGVALLPLLLASGLVLLAGIGAILLPAWRAARLDPMVALRVD